MKYIYSFLVKKNNFIKRNLLRKHDNRERKEILQVKRAEKRNACTKENIRFSIMGENQVYV